MTVIWAGRTGIDLVEDHIERAIHFLREELAAQDPECEDPYLLKLSHCLNHLTKARDMVRGPEPSWPKGRADIICLETYRREKRCTS